MAEIKLQEISKQFGPVKVINHSDFTIKDKEFAVILGPSGCGKSTLLRMIAGLEDISSGKIIINNRRVDTLPPKDRGCAMVFQNYALYPHMTVKGNIGYSLRIAGVPKAKREKRISETAELLGLSDLMDRKPGRLSGGQRQRVAIGRALVREPDVFLFDEPLSNLDAKLRTKMRLELRRLHDRISATTLYVTHDQVEAMTLADRIVIINRGRIEQIGTPKEIYKQPATQFVAGFIGTPQTNFFRGTMDKTGNRFTDSGGEVFDLPEAFTRPVNHRDVVLGIRPEDVEMGGSTVTARVDLVEELGSHRILHCSCGSTAISVLDESEEEKQPGEPVSLGFPSSKLLFFDPETGSSIQPEKTGLV